LYGNRCHSGTGFQYPSLLETRNHVGHVTRLERRVLQLSKFKRHKILQRLKRSAFLGCTATLLADTLHHAARWVKGEKFSPRQRVAMSIVEELSQNTVRICKHANQYMLLFYLLFHLFLRSLRAQLDHNPNVQYWSSAMPGQGRPP